MAASRPFRWQEPGGSSPELRVKRSHWTLAACHQRLPQVRKLRGNTRGSRSSPFPFPALGHWYWEGSVSMQVSGEMRTWQSQGPLKLILENPSFPRVGAASACLLPAPTPFPNPRGLRRKGQGRLATSPRHQPSLHLPSCLSPTDLPPTCDHPVTHVRTFYFLCPSNPSDRHLHNLSLMSFLGHPPCAMSSVGTMHSLFRLSLLMTLQGIVYRLNGHTNSCRVIRSYHSCPKASWLVLDF